MMMRRREGIGFGGLASEIGWLTRSRGDVVWLDEEELIEGLMDRFKAAREDAQYLIEIAVKCNMIEVENGKIRAKLQDNTPIG